MNLYGADFYTDQQLIDEIKGYAAARKKILQQGYAKIQGEGRMVEFVNTKDSLANYNTDLREMMAEARRRGLSIGGNSGGAIAVEIGL